MALTSALVLSVMVAVPTRAGEECAISGVTVTDDGGAVALRNTSCGDVWYRLNADNVTRDAEYMVTRTRSAGTQAYRITITPVGDSAFTTTMTFGVRFDTGVDSVVTAWGKARFVDLGISEPAHVSFTAAPVVVTVCGPPGDAGTCPPQTVTMLAADFSFDAQYSDITSSAWSVPSDTSSMSVACPTRSPNVSSLGVTVTMQGPETTHSGTPNRVDTALVLPRAATTACWGKSADTFADGVVLLGAAGALPRVEVPVGAAQFGMADPGLCGGACVRLSGVELSGGAARTYTVAYAYRTQSATSWRNSFLAKPSSKKAGLTRKNTRNWTITIRSGSSSACVHNGNAVSALRSRLYGPAVVCKYTIRYEHKSGKRWKTKRVGGAFVA